MAEPAQDQLSRILYMLPAAARPDGVALEELATALGVSIDTLKDDIFTVTEREFYHPAGSVDPLSIFLDGDRIRIMSKQGFDRPVRLSERETLALGLGLRALAAECDDDERPAVLQLAAALESSLAAPGIDELMPDPDRAMRSRTEVGRNDVVEYDPADDLSLTIAVGDDAFRGVLTDAAVACRWCTISYLKPGDEAPQPRRIAPYQLVYADGAWYVIAHDASRHAVRTFRLDRMLDAQLDDGTFERPSDFDIQAYVAERGAPYMSDEEIEVPVRYSASVARWVRERTPAGAAIDEVEDGSVLVRHRVSDQRWIVRHVLQYGGDAVVESGPCRAAVHEAARRLSS